MEIIPCKKYPVPVRKDRCDMYEICLLICLAGAGLWDLQAGRIPNRWLGWWYLVGFGLSACSGWLAAAGYLFRSAVTVSILFLFFLCRMIGAGDIKCIALICGYLKLPYAARILGMGMVVGALWSLFKLVRKRLVGKRLRYLLLYIERVFHEKRVIEYYVPERDGREVTLPLAFCLFLGFGLYLLFTPMAWLFFG